MKFNTTPETRVIRAVFKEKYNIDLTDDMLNEIDVTFFSVRKENIYDIGIYRGINLLMFLALTLLAFFAGSSNWVKIPMAVFTVYNFIHLIQTIRRYKKAKRETRPDNG